MKMLKHIKLSYLFLLGLAVLCSSFSELYYDDCSSVTYTKDIAPILKDNGCSGMFCHRNGSGGISLKTYGSTKLAVKNPKFLLAINHREGAEAMPKGKNKLSDEEIAKIECWIENGTPL